MIEWKYWDAQGRRVDSQDMASRGCLTIYRDEVAVSRQYCDFTIETPKSSRSEGSAPTDDSKALKSAELREGAEEEEEELTIELKLEPIGMDRKSAEEYRKKAPQVYAARMQTAVKAFENELKRIYTSTKETLDMEHIRFLTELAVKRFVEELQMTSERAVQLLLENGLASVGIDMLNQKVSPEVVRALYYESPQWLAYKRMETDLISKTNDIIRHHMIVAPAGIDKYGAAHGLDKELMIKDLSRVIGIGEKRARLISRTESRVIQNKGKELGFKMRDPSGQWRYKLGGPYDPKERGGRLRDSCRYVMEQMPQGGYELEQLKVVWKDACKYFQPKLVPRDFSGGPNCRHFPQKVVTTWNVRSEVPQEEPYDRDIR